MVDPAAPITRPPGLPGAAAVRARAAGENFPVAMRLLPRGVRAALLAFYDYARLVDEIGDSYEGDRLRALDWVEQEVTTPAALHHPGCEPRIAAAVDAAERCGAGTAPLLDLVEANRQDQTVATYATWDDLVKYCSLSANPVGHLVLHAFGAATPSRIAMADDICTALQVAEHLQDIAEDHAVGRVYLPQADLGRFGVDGHLLATGHVASFEVRALVAFEAARARRMLDGAASLPGTLNGAARVAVAGFLAGGYATLDAIAAQSYDPLVGTPRPAPHRLARHLVASLLPRREKAAA